MKEKENQTERETCQIGSCGCSLNYIWFGIAVILFVMIIAVILSNYGF